MKIISIVGKPYISTGYSIVRLDSVKAIVFEAEQENEYGLVAIHLDDKGRIDTVVSRADFKAFLDS
jgi:hypothetical protein